MQRSRISSTIKKNDPVNNSRHHNDSKLKLIDPYCKYILRLMEKLL